MYSTIHLPLHFLIAFFALLNLRSLTVSAAGCHADDETGLLGFKSAIRYDPSGFLSSWKKGTDCCNWNGVTCLTGPRVSSLFLVGQPDNLTTALSGTISPSLSKLKYLDGIYLQDLKNLTGPFPSFLFTLPKLLYIYLDNNRLSGPIPDRIGNLTNLDVLNLEGNRFSGPIPASIGGMTQLTRLQLGGNLLTGGIPVTIKQLKNLSQLHLDRNHLSGPIPDMFSGFPDLIRLRLSYNKFTGTIPGSISALAPGLQYLELGHNFLTGKIPEFLGRFRALDTMDLSANKLSGTVPKSFGNLTKIFNLDLSRNNLVDPFPEMRVKGIESLDLSYNNFRLVKIPEWVRTSPILYSLKLAKCKIKMRLDDWNPVQTYFYDYVDLSDNEITGSPVRLLNRTGYLVGFYASGNELKFNFESVKIPTTLRYLDLSRNLMFGKVPKVVSGLSELNVSRNHLCGQLPATKFPASAFAENDCLCGSPLPLCKA